MTADFTAERSIMVDSQVRTQDVTDLALIDAMRMVPREAVTPPDRAWQAYADTEIPYAPGRWLLRPRDVAKLMQALRPRAGERALAIAAPYAAAVLERIGLRVEARDAADSRPIEAEYDLIICEGAVAKAPPAWLGALADGGRLGVVERDGPVGRAMLYLRHGDTVGGRPLFDSTPPVLEGFEARRGFSF
jgi:protein-L-isoaspartate(D-aspartate) O-methyltransferase